MSKIPMKRIFIAGLKKDRKYILETLQRAGVVEVASKNIEDEDLIKMNVMAEKVSFDRNSAALESSLETLGKLSPDENAGLLSSLEGPKEITLSEYEDRIKSVTEALAKANKITELAKEIAEHKAAIPKLENRLIALKPWTNLDIPLNFSGTEKTAVIIGTLKNEVPPEEVYQAIQSEFEEARDEEAKVDVNVISSTKEMTCLMIICLKEDAYLVESALKKLDFAKVSITGLIPQQEINNAEKEIKAHQESITARENDIRSFAKDRSSLQFAEDYYRMRADKYGVLVDLPQSEAAFFVDGYVPAACADQLSSLLTGKFDCEVRITQPGEEEDVPVALTNNPYSDPMETVVESYSLPGKAEFDPSFVVSLFYYIFFGLMLSDAGYGLLLTAGTGAALMKVKNMKPGMKKLMKLFFFSGISTIFWGIMFGSFFGDAVNVIATTFFNRPDIALKPLWFEPVSEPMRMLVFAFGLGIVHLFTGLGCKGYLCIKNKDYEGLICDVLFWAMFVGGGIVYLLTMPMITGMMNLDLNLGDTVAKIAAGVAIAGMIGVVLTGGRESKNPVKRLLKGAYAAYGVTGWLSDILSYSRLLALGLATGVIAQVFNKMGSMLGGSFFGILIFIAVFLVGHVLNLGINILGAYVHTNRLQFVEFFGKFYEGGGKPYEPFTEKTKYYCVKEDK